MKKELPKGFKAVSGFADDNLVEFSFFKDGLVCTFLETREISNEKGERDYIMHRFQTKEGVVSTWGCGHLNYLLKNVDKNTKVYVLYCGKEAVKGLKGVKGQKEIHKWEVAISDEK